MVLALALTLNLFQQLRPCSDDVISTDNETSAIQAPRSGLEIPGKSST